MNRENTIKAFFVVVLLMSNFSHAAIIELELGQIYKNNVSAKIVAKSVSEIVLSNEVIIAEPSVMLSEAVEIAGKPSYSFTFVADLVQSDLD